jgi:hypothetical protein
MGIRKDYQEGQAFDEDFQERQKQERVAKREQREEERLRKQQEREERKIQDKMYREERRAKEDAEREERRARDAKKREEAKDGETPTDGEKAKEGEAAKDEGKRYISLTRVQEGKTDVVEHLLIEAVIADMLIMMRRKLRLPAERNDMDTAEVIAEVARHVDAASRLRVGGILRLLVAHRLNLNKVLDCQVCPICLHTSYLQIPPNATPNDFSN